MSAHGGLYREYERKIEEVSAMPDFVTSYNESLINSIVFMTPAEELEYLEELKEELEEELDARKKELDEKDREIKELRAKLNAQQEQ